MAASSQAKQEPAVTALGCIAPAPAQLQPAHEQAAAPTSSTVPTCNWDLQPRDSTALAVERLFLPPLQKATRVRIRPLAAAESIAAQGEALIARKERVAFLRGGQ